jgi:hypothetical protein
VNADVCLLCGGPFGLSRFQELEPFLDGFAHVGCATDFAYDQWLLRSGDER